MVLIVKTINRLLDILLIVGLLPLFLISIYALLDVLLVSHSALIDRGVLRLAETQSDQLFDEIDSKYVIAWIKIDDTNINYPVVQGSDNAWFLNRNYKGVFATAGSIFLDYRNTKNFSDSFSIIYGHRMGNGEMFSDIQKFKNGEFFNSHQEGVLSLRERFLNLKIIAYAEIDDDDWAIYNVEKSANDKASQAINKVFDAAI